MKTVLRSINLGKYKKITMIPLYASLAVFKTRMWSLGSVLALP